MHPDICNLNSRLTWSSFVRSEALLGAEASGCLRHHFSSLGLWLLSILCYCMLYGSRMVAFMTDMTYHLNVEFHFNQTKCPEAFIQLSLFRLMSLSLCSFCKWNEIYCFQVLAGAKGGPRWHALDQPPGRQGVRVSQGVCAGFQMLRGVVGVLGLPGWLLPRLRVAIRAGSLMCIYHISIACGAAHLCLYLTLRNFVCITCMMTSLHAHAWCIQMYHSLNNVKAIQAVDVTLVI